MDKKLKLICESDLHEYKVITESQGENGPKTYKMEGVYLMADTKNGNNRIYPYDNLKKTVDKFIDEKIKTNSALEELEHSSEVTINPQNVCCRTVDLKPDGKQWIGTSIILASQPKFDIPGTKNGDLLLSLLTHECACGHSSRGVGNVNESTGVVEDYQMICIDTVLNPSIGIFNKSNADRFVNGILESKNFIIDVHGDILEEHYVGLEKDLSHLPNTFIQSKKNEAVAKAVMKFLERFRA